MNPVTNPYAPGAGSEPPELAGREEIFSRTEIMLARVKLGRPVKSFMLVGLRGVGKTVLLNKIEEMANKKGFKVTLIEAHENKSLPELMIPSLRRILLSLDYKQKVDEVVKRGLRVLASFATATKITISGVGLGLSIDPELGSADSGDIEADLPELFLAVGQAAESRGTAVAVIIDELQYVNSKEFSALIMAMHKISQKNLPLILIGAGLPQLVALAGKSKSYAERLFDYPEVGALKPSDAIAALAEPADREGVEYNKNALNEIIKLTQGYPYFLQEWGYRCWNEAAKSPITKTVVKRATASAIENLDESFFRVRFDRVTPREREYLVAMSELGEGPHRSGDIAAQMSVAVESIAPVRNSLIKKGMVYSPAHGDTAFTVPLFHEYLERVRQRL